MRARLACVAAFAAGAAFAAAFLLRCTTGAPAHAGDSAAWEYAFLYATQDAQAWVRLPDEGYVDGLVEGCGGSSGSAFTCGLNALADDGWEPIGFDHLLEAVLRRRR